MSKILRNLPDIFSKKRDSNLRALTGSIDSVLETTSKDLDLLELQYNIQTATGVWLDMWGEWFGILRDKDETDDVYRNRIMTTTLRPKCTIPALIGAIRNYLEDGEAPIHIHEPYLDLFKHNQSIWGHRNYYPDSVYHSRGVIDIHSEITLEGPLRDLIEQIKSAGVKVAYTEVLNLGKGPLEISTAVKPKAFFRRTATMEAYSLLIPILRYSRDGELSGGKILWRGPRQRITDLSVNMFSTAFPTLNELKDMVLSDIKDKTIKMLFEERAQPVITHNLNYLGYFSHSSRAAYSSARGALSGHRLTQYDLENPLPYEDTPLRFKGKYIPLKEKREAYTNVSKSMDISSDLKDANKIRVVKYSHHSSSIMFSILSNQLNVGSSIILEDIWGKSLRDISLLEDNSQLPVESISETV